jgi:hypothetical protein
MAATGGGGSLSGASESREDVADLLDWLNLTMDEGEVAAFSDDEDGEDAVVKWAVIGKVLSPATIHVTTIRNAMKPAWGNPFSLKFCSVGEKTENLFIAEFGSADDKKRALEGSPWMVGKHAVVLQEYDEALKPSDVSFAKMEMWVRILNLPFGWMNERRGSRAAGLVGQVIKMDVDADGEASGPFLHARVLVEVDKPLWRGVMLKPDKNSKPEWFEIQFEKLPFYCFPCGIMGHTEIECPSPSPRNALGKLPYDLRLRAPEEKRRFQSFGQAADESFGSSTGSKRASSSHNSSDTRPPRGRSEVDREEEGVISPIKTKSGSEQGDRDVGGKVQKNLFKEHGQRKRKPNAGTPDLNLPALVHDRIAQLGSTSSHSEDATEVQKNKKQSHVQDRRRSRWTTPAGHNESLVPELPGLWAARGSS